MAVIITILILESCLFQDNIISKENSIWSQCKESHGLISCYRWFDYFWTLCVGVETPTYKLYINQLEISESKMLFKHLKKSPRQQILRE